MNNRLEDILNNLYTKIRKIGKYALIGKTLGLSIGIIAGWFFGREVYEEIEEKVANPENIEHLEYMVKVPPYLIGAYIGQKIGGLIGFGYYTLNKKIH